jgi:mRNA interferase HicA
MKRRDLLWPLEAHGCELLREGGNHTLYVNRAEQKTAPIPRHQEVKTMVARQVCRILRVPEPPGA